MKFKIDNIPTELHHLKQWVCWRKIITDKGKTSKIPINPFTGGNAMSNNTDTWSDMMTAVIAVSQYNLDGIGFMFNDDYFGIDLDDCDNELRNEFIEGMQSYTEISQSGNGIHIICKGHLPINGARRKGGVEMYDSGRFFVMTGDDVGNYNIIDGTERVLPLYNKYLAKEEKTVDTKEQEIIYNKSVFLTDAEILKKAQNSKNGIQFKMLFDGQWEGLNYPSQSEADLALANLLAFWCGKNFEQMDRIFRISGLYRDKYDRRQSGTTYGAITLTTAIDNCSTVYSNAHQDESTVLVNSKTGQVSFGTSVAYELNDTGNAQRMVDRFTGYVKYNFDNKCWKVWNGRFWQNDVTNQIKGYAEVIINDMKVDAFQSEDEKERKEKLQNVKRAFQSSGKEALLKECQHLDTVPAVNNDFDNNDFMLNVENGIIDLETGKLLDHDKELMMSKFVPIEMHISNIPSNWLKFLDEIFQGDKEMIKFIQKAVGYTLTGSIREQGIFICYGDGSNGKSVFLDIVGRLLGDYSATASVDTIIEKKFGSGGTSELARLKSARFVTTAENNEGSKLNEGLIKQITGGEKITARFLYGTEFEFYPNFKLWLATNHKPIIRGTDTGIWRRIMAIPFKYKVPEAKRDKSLVFKLEKELPKIMSWAVEGCLLWQKEGLGIPDVIAKATKDYKNEMDIISTFVSENCEEAVNHNTSAKEMYSAYERWAKSSNEYLMSATKFGRELAKKFEKVRKSYGVVYKNIRLLSDNPDYNYRRYDM